MGRYSGYTWVYSPKAEKVTEEIKKDIGVKSEQLIKILKKQYIQKLPKKLVNNHLIDIYSKWIQQRFYFCSKYICPKNALYPGFENRFARLDYTGIRINGKDKFQLFFMRHTGEWIKILEDKTLNECFNAIRTLPYFAP